MIAPTEITWAMQLDWRYHFLGWHFFRHEPWHLPLGRIDGYFEPLGTSVGLTDAIPIAAFVLKPFATFLPSSFQYLGLWLLLCFVLQGLFGALLMRLWTSRAALQLLGAACFILVPTLLMRIGHPALCSHWLLLWAIWLYLRPDLGPRAALVQATGLALIAGLVHPYLALMVVALIGALSVRFLLAGQSIGIATLLVPTAVTLGGWWLSGLFVLSNAEDLRSEGLGKYSTNLLAPIMPAGWSTIMPEIPIGAEGQTYEGAQYLGAGLLLLILLGIVVRFRVSSDGSSKGLRSSSVVLWPLVLVVTLLAIYSLSPRVTFGSLVLFEIQSSLLEWLAIFRATGRFFWPATYLMVAMALAVLVSRLRPSVAAAALIPVVALQLFDLRDAHALRRRTARDEAFYSWRSSLQSPAWARAMSEYEHVVVHPPAYCPGTPPVDVESLGLLAGAYGLSLNSGLVARFDERRRQAACRDLIETLSRGEVDDSRIYIGRPGEIESIVTRAPQQPMVCGTLDGVGVCVTARSYERWRDAAHLE